MRKIKFDEKKNDYQKARTGEAEVLCDYLSKNDYFCAKVGHGRTYTSRGTIAALSLANWIWVTVTRKDGMEFIISLNALDMDTSSGNFHALYDRVGIYYTKNVLGSFIKTSVTTDIDLPFTDESLEKLLELLKSL